MAVQALEKEDKKSSELSDPDALSKAIESELFRKHEMTISGELDPTNIKQPRQQQRPGSRWPQQQHSSSIGDLERYAHLRKNASLRLADAAVLLARREPETTA